MHALPLHQDGRMVVTCSGYKASLKEFTLGSEEALDMGSIEMRPISKLLDDIVVIAGQPPVKVRQDTIKFNAALFRTLPTTLVEDLLRKLPGVQVDRKGNITANGRRVNRIMPEKKFFDDDSKIATYSLPANGIEKVQVTEGKNEMACNSDGYFSNRSQVTNLTLKKGVRKSWW